LRPFRRYRLLYADYQNAAVINEGAADQLAPLLIRSGACICTGTDSWSGIDQI